MTKIDFMSQQEMQQGAVESMALFTLGINALNNETNEESRKVVGVLVAGADATYIVGPPKEAFECLMKHKERLKNQGQ